MNNPAQNSSELIILTLPNGREVRFENAGGGMVCLETICIEGLIIEGLWGFNDLGDNYCNCIQNSLGIEEDEIRKLCSENTYKNDKISLMLLHSRNPISRLKAVVLVPTQHCLAYKEMAAAVHGKPYRDFYYNVIYEALRLLGEAECEEIAFAGLSGFCGYNATDPIIGKCAVEAVAHYTLRNPSISKVVRMGDAPDFSEGIGYFNKHPDKVGYHRDIQRTLEVLAGVTFCTIMFGN